jgi:hypothetical protein
VAWHSRHTGDEFEQEDVTYGDLSDEDRPYAQEQKEDLSWEEDSDTEFLVYCCKEDRPLRKGGQKLVVKSSPGNHFVTIQVYVCGEHHLPIQVTFLMARSCTSMAHKFARGHFASQDFFSSSSIPAPQNREWMVYGRLMGPAIKLEEKGQWIRTHEPPRPPNASTATLLQKLTASSNT